MRRKAGKGGSESPNPDARRRGRRQVRRMKRDLAVGSG